MRPIDFMNMSPRNRMLNALAGGGLGRLGLVERLGAGGDIILDTRMTPALTPVSPTVLMPAAEIAPIPAVQTVTASPGAGARVDTGVSSEAYNSSEGSQVLARRGSTSPTEAPTNVDQVRNQNAPIDDRANPEFAKGSDYNPYADEVPSQSPDVPHSTLPKAPVTGTSRLAVGPSVDPSAPGAPFPWAKALGIAAVLGIGYMLVKGE